MYWPARHLWRADFFDCVLFQGGTSLRFLHGLPRFSEDLDFILRVPDPDFDWSPHLKGMTEVFAQFGLKLTVQPRPRMDTAIREALLKDDSFASQHDLSFAGTGHRKLIKIKLEIDATPPRGSGEATIYLDFPADYRCVIRIRRRILRYRFTPYYAAAFSKFANGSTFPGMFPEASLPMSSLLQNALVQARPWAEDTSLRVDMQWLNDSLSNAIKSIAWKETASDVECFLRPADLKSVDLWNERFFSPSSIN